MSARPETSALTSVEPDEVGMSLARLDDARALMQRQFDEGLSPTLVAVVARHGRVVLSHAVGDQRPGGPPVSVDSVFPMASQTKPVTAAVIMCLVERGLVGLNEPASVHLPELAADHEDVLVAHLLTHTSGWNEEDVVADREAHLDELIVGFSGDGDLMTHILLGRGSQIPRREPVGVLMQYCNLNYSLLGEIVRRTTGTTLGDAMRRFIFEPLGMNSSTTVLGDDLAERVIERPAGIPYGPDHDFSPVSFNDPLWAECDDGAGGLYSSPVDYLRFQQAILDGGVLDGVRILSRSAVEVMTTNRIPGTPAELIGQTTVEGSWGYGFGIGGAEMWHHFSGGIRAPGAIFHGGAGGIYAWADPATDIAGVYIDIATEVDEFSVPLSWAAHRFDDVISAAVLD